MFDAFSYHGKYIYFLVIVMATSLQFVISLDAFVQPFLEECHSSFCDFVTSFG